jgi:hypothetical protein
VTEAAPAKTFVKLAGINEEQRLVFGMASMSVSADGEIVTDLQNDQIEPAELEKAFYDFVEQGGAGDVNHDRKEVSSLVECFVVTKEKLAMLLKACGYKGDMPEYNGAAAWCGWRVNDDAVWKRVKSGELRGFSIEARAQRVPVEEDAA